MYGLKTTPTSPPSSPKTSTPGTSPTSTSTLASTSTSTATSPTALQAAHIRWTRRISASVLLDSLAIQLKIRDRDANETKKQLREERTRLREEIAVLQGRVGDIERLAGQLDSILSVLGESVRAKERENRELRVKVGELSKRIGVVV